MTEDRVQADLIEEMMMNCLKRKIDEIFGDDNNVCFTRFQDQKAIYDFEQIKFSDIEKLKEVIQDVEIKQTDGQTYIVFDWNKKTMKTAEQFTTGNFISDGFMTKKIKGQTKA